MGAPKPNYLNIKLPLGRGLKGWVIERPGRHLPGSELTKLRNLLIEVGTKCLPSEPLDYGVFSDDMGAFDRSIITLLIDKKTSLPVAFNSMPVLDIEITSPNFENLVKLVKKLVVN